MLLDALMAATERLIITYTGNDERTNLRRPPAVPVGELLDIVERTVRSERRRGARSGRDPPSAAAVRSPELRPRQARARPALELRPAGARAARRRSTRPARPRRAVPAGAAPAPTDPVVELDNLVRFVEHPVRALLRDRLGISVSEFFDEVEDAMPVELDALGEWGVGQRLLDGVLAGAELDACMQAEIARGTLPPGELGAPGAREIGAVVDAARRRGEGPRRRRAAGIARRQPRAAATGARSPAPSPACAATRSARSPTRACARGTGCARG